LFLHEIEHGRRIFIDANIFVYHFSKDSGFNKSCKEFFIRVENSEIHGVTSAVVIQEATHRLMMSEASSIIDVEVKNLPKYLKQRPDVVKQLTRHLMVPGKIANLNIEIIPVTTSLIEESQVGIDPGQTSHQWNVVGVVACSFLRLFIDAGSAVSGSITNFKVLTSKY